MQTQPEVEPNPFFPGTPLRQIGEIASPWDSSRVKVPPSFWKFQILLNCRLQRRNTSCPCSKQPVFSRPWRPLHVLFLCELTFLYFHPIPPQTLTYVEKNGQKPSVPTGFASPKTRVYRATEPAFGDDACLYHPSTVYHGLPHQKSEIMSWTLQVHSSSRSQQSPCSSSPADADFGLGLGPTDIDFGDRKERDEGKGPVGPVG